MERKTSVESSREKNGLISLMDGFSKTSNIFSSSGLSLSELEI
jgi:hypothetical protein